MTKKDYCLQNQAVAGHDYYRMYLHGIEYGIDDYAYISRFYKETLCGKSKVSFHKVKIRYDVDGNPYVNITEKLWNGAKHRIYVQLNNFIRLNCPEFAQEDIVSCL